MPSLLGGTHDLKAGVQLSWERMAYDRVIPIVDITARLLSNALSSKH